MDPYKIQQLATPQYATNSVYGSGYSAPVPVKAPISAPTPVPSTPAPSAPASAVSTPPAATQQPEPTISSMYGGLSPEDQAYSAMQSQFKYTSPDAYTVDQQNADRASVIARHQQEIDAANRMMEQELIKSRTAGQDRLGQGYAIQARRGMLGSNVGGAITEKINGLNDEEQSMIRAKYMSQIASIMGAANTEATNEINARMQAAQQGYNNYLEYLKGGADRAKARAISAAKTILANGVDVLKDPTLLSAIAKNYQLSPDILTAAYLDEKRSNDDTLINQKYKEALTQNQLDQNRYKSIADGGQLWDTTTGQMIANNPKDQKARAAVAFATESLNIPDKYKDTAGVLVARVASGLPSTRVDAFYDAINSSRNMEDLIGTLMTNSNMSAEMRNDFAKAGKSIQKINKALKLLDKKIETGIAQFGQQWLYNKAGFDADPEIADLQAIITMAQQEYRNSITGAAWGPQEDAEYNALIGSTKFEPAALKNRLDNFAALLKGGMISTIESSLDPISSIMGGGMVGDVLNTSNRSADTTDYDSLINEYLTKNPKATREEVQQYLIEQSNQSSARQLDAAREAIASIESSGNGDYEAVGKKTGSGDKAYGRYQVMGNNIPSWTKQYVGREMTPEEFLADPAAQDAVFNGHFATLVNKYGSYEDAASAWFSGRPLKGNKSKDVNGTSVPQYVMKFKENFNSNLS